MNATIGKTTQLCRVKSSALALNDNESPAKLKKAEIARKKIQSISKMITKDNNKIVVQ